MAVPIKHNIKEILQPYHNTILGIVVDAFAEWRTIQDLRVKEGMSPLLYSRTIANYVFDAIARRAILAFGAEPKVLVSTETQTFKVHLNGVVVRFKKGGEDGLGCNIPTQAALAFMSIDGLLPGLPAETAKIEIIWRANDIGTQLDGVFVVARDGDRLLWEYQIDDTDAGSVPIPLPTMPDDPSEDDAAYLVKPKRVDKSKAQ